MLRLRADERFRFVFAGGGPLRADLEEFGRANGLRLLAFRPYCAREELGNALAEGDIGLVTQKPETLGCVVPSKTYGIMAAARPVLFIGPREATPARIIRRFDCGWQVDCGDTENLVALLRQLAEHPELIHSAGRRAREAFLARYDLPVGAGRICRILGAGSVLGEMAQAAAVRAV